jgi:prevent-host-death family protein
MKYIGMKHARAMFPELVQLAEAGHEILITRKGRAVARLIGTVRVRKPLPSLREFRDSLRTNCNPSVPSVREERSAR